jgi:Fe-S-cluster-containing dehydrogenase component
MSMDRRTLLKGLAVAGTGAAVGSTPAEASAPMEAPADAVGMLYDATRCIGCRACVTACKTANDLPGNIYDPPNDLGGDTKNIIKKYEVDGVVQSYMKAQCMQCIDPGCASACMIGAFKKREYGIVTWDGTRCIGCRYCQVACPYNIPKFQWDTPNPKIVKCELCLHIIHDPETGQLREGAMPGCCQSCPKEAVIFGKYTDLMADAKDRIAKHPDRYWGPDGTPKIFGESDGGGTQVLYLAGVDFENLGLPPLGEEGSAALARSIQHGLYQGFIAPSVLLVGLAAVVWRNRRTSDKEGGE